MINKTLHIKLKMEQQKTGDDLMCSGRVGKFCSTLLFPCINKLPSNFNAINDILYRALKIKSWKHNYN